MARHDFMLDVALTPERGIAGVFAGEPVAAHAEGVEFVKRTTTQPVSELADVVITSAAGYPLDLTFYQIIKGITAAAHICKPGGRILILAECSEGVGSPEFLRKLESYRGHGEFLEEIREAAVEIDQWQLEKLALTGNRFELLFYTPGVQPREAGVLGASMFPTADAAVRAALRGLAGDSRVAVVPEGPYVYARVV